MQYVLVLLMTLTIQSSHTEFATYMVQRQMLAKIDCIKTA
jgi:hypothetical protein